MSETFHYFLMVICILLPVKHLRKM